MKKLIILLLIIIPFESFGQSFAGKQPRRMPVKYLKPDFDAIADLKPSNVLTNNVWSIWIDRKGVKTSNGKMPPFMQRFLVVEENDTKIHIVLADDSYDNSLGQFTKEPEDYGWIGKELCVLSPSALYSTKTNFRIKVMTITTPELMQKDLERIREGAKKLAFYDSPTSLTPNNNETPLFEMFFILKREGSRYLLSKRVDISRGKADDYVNGWVEIKSVQTWDQRQALEPNWDQDAGAERQRENVKSSVFPSKEKAEQYLNSRDGSEAIWNDDKFSKRYGPYWKRFPVFSKDGNFVETAVVSDLIQEDGNKVNNNQIVEIQKMYNEQRQKSRNINLVFVIDGTESMGPYMESVRSAVISSTTALQNSDNNFKYGAIIYRDYINPEDNQCYLKHQLSDYRRFSGFMSSVDTKDPSCADKTTSEGLYLGLKMVEEILRGRELETNIIILIGDSGDREGEGRITEDDVIPLIKRYGCSILAMQVHRNDDQSYDDFIVQVKDLGMRNADEIASNMKQKYGKANLSALNSQPRWIQSSSDKRTLFALDYSPVSGALQYTRKKEIISPATAQDEIRKIISSTDAKNDSLLKELEVLINGQFKVDSTKISGFSSEVLQILMKAGFTLEQINILKQKNYQFLLSGTTPLEFPNMKTPIYNYVLFLDQEELNDLKVSLDKIYTPGETGYARRESLANSWMEILRANYGVSREDLANKNLSQLMELITGLPSPNPLLKKYTMDDLRDKLKLPDDEFDQIVNLIKTKRDELSRISGNREFMFLSNDRAYYWIPQRYLP